MSLVGEHSLIDMTSPREGGGHLRLRKLNHKEEKETRGKGEGMLKLSVDGRIIYYVSLYCCYEEDPSL